MERKIGEIFEYNGEWYQCVEDTEDISCVNCCFYNGGHKLCTDEDMGACVKEYRSDAKSICFKKLEKVGEPISVNGKNVQLLKTTIANCDNCVFYKDVNCDFTSYPRKCHGGEEGTYVEIKTKEDMEEKKLNLKPFDIQKAREGKPVCTRDGRKARIICFDRINGDYYKIVACVTDFDGDFEEVLFYGIDGYIVDSQNPKDQDLMILSEKKKGWVNIVRGSNGSPHMGRGIFQSKEEAENAIKAFSDNLIDTVKINWEE